MYSLLILINKKGWWFNKSREVSDWIICTSFMFLSTFWKQPVGSFELLFRATSRKQNPVFSALSNSSTRRLKRIPAASFRNSYVWKLRLIFLHVENGFALFATPACMISNILLKENFEHGALCRHQPCLLCTERDVAAGGHFWGAGRGVGGQVCLSGWMCSALPFVPGSLC